LGADAAFITHLLSERYEFDNEVRQNMTRQQDFAVEGRRRFPKPGFLRGGFGPALRFIFRVDNLRHLPRLLHEGASPLVRLAIQAHNTAEITRLLRDERQLSFISSFPRSGNTWIRYLLADVYLQSRGVATTTQLPVHPDKIIPDFYCNWMARPEVTVPPPAVFVKTHDPFPQLHAWFGGVLPRAAAGGGAAVPAFRGCKYLYRSPEDALVSLFHYYDCQKHLRYKTAIGMDAFCRDYLPVWAENLDSYLRAAEEGFPVLFVPYELLLQYPAEILSNLLRWLGARHDGATVERAVSNMQFSKLHAVENRSVSDDAAFQALPRECASLAASRGAFKEEAFFFRRGCKGSGRSELQESTMNLILERTAHLMEQANTRVLTQQSLPGTSASPKTAQIRRDAAFQNRQSRRLPAEARVQKA
jgi:hypothetical protein